MYGQNVVEEEGVPMDLRPRSVLLLGLLEVVLVVVVDNEDFVPSLDYPCILDDAH